MIAVIYPLYRRTTGTSCVGVLAHLPEPTHGERVVIMSSLNSLDTPILIRVTDGVIELSKAIFCEDSYRSLAYGLAQVSVQNKPTPLICMPPHRTP